MANDSTRHHNNGTWYGWHGQDDHHERGDRISARRMSNPLGRGTDSEPASAAEVTWRFVITGVSLYFFFAGVFVAIGQELTGG